MLDAPTRGPFAFAAGGPTAGHAPHPGHPPAIADDEAGDPPSPTPAAEGGAALDPDRLAADFASRVSELAEAARRVRRGSDPEAVHDLRVAARRLSAALRVWRTLLPARTRRAAARPLRRLRRRLGRTRELEVSVELLEARLGPGGPLRHGPLDSLLGRMRERLARRRRAATRRVSPRRLKRLLGRLEAAGTALRAAAAAAPGRAREAREFERELAEAARAAVAHAREHPDDETLHGARIRVKKWRYTLECLREALPDAGWPATRPLRGLQAALGDLHDRAEIRAALERRAVDAGDDRGGEELRSLVARLDRESAAALRRFRRLAAGLAGEAAAPEPAGAPPRPAAGPAAADGGPDPSPARAAPTAIGGTARPAPTEARGAAGDPDARAARWARMARWLERGGERR